MNIDEEQYLVNNIECEVNVSSIIKEEIKERTSKDYVKFKFNSNDLNNTNDYEIHFELYQSYAELATYATSIPVELMTNINRFETKNLFVVYKKQNISYIFL